jgi:hypothetical protein
MAVILELIFGLFQLLPIWGDKEKSTSNKYVAVALAAFILVVVILIYVNNPSPDTGKSELV